MRRTSPNIAASAGCFRRRSRPGVWPASRRMTGTVRARRVLARRPRKRRGGSRINASLRAKTEHRKLQRCLFCEKRHQRSAERTHDQHPRSPNRHCPDQWANRWCAPIWKCDRRRWTIRSGLISVLSCHARNRPTSSARPNALPCWRPVIQRNFPACHQVRSCLTWPIKHIWPLRQ